MKSDLTLSSKNFCSIFCSSLLWILCSSIVWSRIWKTNKDKKPIKKHKNHYQLEQIDILWLKIEECVQMLQQSVEKMKTFIIM